MSKPLPQHLHAAFDHTDAAGELTEFASLRGKALEQYIRESVANSDRAVREEDLRELHAWMQANPWKGSV